MARRLSETITIRLDARSIRVLRARARAEKRSTSAVVREFIEEKVREQEPPTAYELTKKWVGAIKTDKPVDIARRARELMAGWNPDRRG